MSEIIQSQTPMSSMGTVAIAIGTALATGQAYWPSMDAPAYVIQHTGSSYSQVTEQVLASIENPHSSFVDHMASIYASLSQRQQLLGQDFEAAIFDDLDSLYES